MTIINSTFIIPKVENTKFSLFLKTKSTEGGIEQKVTTLKVFFFSRIGYTSPSKNKKNKTL
jgi:hypothetical protein